LTVRSISIEAYQRHIESGKQETQWVRIYTYLSHVLPRTRSEISEETKIRMSSVCGRVNELMQAGLLAENERRKCRITGELAHPVRVPVFTQQDLFGGRA